jgi:5'-3' exonuclease
MGGHRIRQGAESPVGQTVAVDQEMFRILGGCCGVWAHALIIRAVRVLYTGKGVRNLDVVDQARLRERYDVPTGRAYAEMAVLRGDPSDGLPGVPGIGEKTAVGLLSRFGGLAPLLRAVEEGSAAIAPGQRAKLAAAAEYLAVAPAVVDVVLDVPVPDDVRDAVPRHPADVDALTELADRWGLRTSVNRVLAAFAQVHEAPAPTP